MVRLKVFLSLFRSPQLKDVIFLDKCFKSSIGANALLEVTIRQAW
jgi:hypothetical protein